MRKNHLEPNLNIPERNTGTYQTGMPEQPTRKSNPIIAVLLVMTIFLGGLASALGIVNIRLVHKLQQSGGTVPVDIFTQGSSATLSGNEMDSSLPEPLLPDKVSACLQLRLPPSASESSKHDLSPADILSDNESALVHLQCDLGHTINTGLGVIMHKNGYILTNAHIVEGANRILVRLADGQTHRAALVGSDALTDLAVLYIQAEGLTPAQFCTSLVLTEDESIASTQDPSPKLKGGTITNAKRKVSIGSYKLQLVQTDVKSCDGPVFNRYGQVIAMNSSKVPGFFGLYTQQGTGYAIPSVTIKEVADQLMQQGFVAGRPTLGIQTQAISKVYQQYWNLPGGLRLLQVSDQAATQGFLEDDILLALGGQRLITNADLHTLLLSHDIGDSLTAVIFRDGQTLTISVTILDTAA